MNRTLLNLGKLFLFVGVLVLSLQYLPWWQIPDYGKAALIIGIGFALLILSSFMRRAPRERREAAKVLVTVLVALALSVVLMTIPVFVGPSLGMEFAEPAPQSSVTLVSFRCNGTLNLNITAVPFHVRVVRAQGAEVRAEMRVPSNLVEDIRRSMEVTYRVSERLGEPSSLTIYTEYERPLILIGFPVSKPELHLEVRIPEKCRVVFAHVESVSGDLEADVDGIFADLRTVSGDVSVRGTFASLLVDSVSGDVNLNVRIGYSGSVNTVSGDIVGKVNAFYGVYENMEGTRGFSATTTSGDVRLELGRDEKVYLDVMADTTSGKIRFEDISLLSSGVSRNVSAVTGREAHGIVGSPDLHEFAVRVHTVSGDVILKYVGD